MRLPQHRLLWRAEICQDEWSGIAKPLKKSKETEVFWKISVEFVSLVKKLLRSTCTQKAETHVFYNAVIMDRAHNRQIVKKQLAKLGISENFTRHNEYKFLTFD